MGNKDYQASSHTRARAWANRRMWRFDGALGTTMEWWSGFFFLPFLTFISAIEIEKTNPFILL